MDVIELLKLISVDVVVLIIFLIAAYIGYQRSYRISFINLMIQLISILIAYFAAGGLAKKVLPYIPESIQVKLLIPDQFYYLIEPYEELIIPVIVFIIMFVISFAVIKSILHVFSVNYEWNRAVFPKGLFNRLGDGIVSSILSMLNAYTYVIILIIPLACPIFDLVKPYSFSGMVLTINPLISSAVDRLYEPYEGLKAAIDLFDDELSSIVSDSYLDLEQLQLFIKKHENQKNEVHEAVSELVPLIATTSGFLSYFPDNRISAGEMSSYLQLMQDYINEDVITLEIFNSYFKELIHNETYDRLIEDEVISDEALKTLINSGMLNDDNLKKMKEYITLD